jgi:NAD(P)-dependent dehydrogenase (short-subunit alcohol dehydrogenase family)
MTSPNFKYINKLEGKRVLLFGSTSGIGYATAEAVLEHGATAILTGTNSEKLNNAIQKLKTTYPHLEEGRVLGYIIDLSNIEQLELNVDELLTLVTKNGAEKINHITFTAGDSVPFFNISNVDLTKIFPSLNVRGLAPVAIAKTILNGDYVVKSLESSFTITGGSISNRPPRGWSFGAFLTGSLSALTRALAVDLAPVRVNIVEPGVVNTSRIAHLPEQVRTMYKESTLTKHLSEPEGVAESYLYLMKDPNLTGVSIYSDSGRALV